MELKNKLKTLGFFLKKKRVVVMCRVFYGEEWLELALRNVEPYVYKIFILKSTKPWDRIDGEEQKEKSVADNIEPILDRLSKNSDKYVIIEKDWGSQPQQLESFLQLLRNKYSEVTHLWIVDSDEIYTTNNARKIVSLCSNIKFFNKALRVNMHTYIKTIYYRVFPLEPYKPLAIIPLRDFVFFSEARNVEGVQKMVTDVYMHHFSLVMKDEERLQKKFRRGVDGFEGVDNWYDRVYKNFNKDTKNFHTIKGHESQWAGVEVVSEKDLPDGVVEVYNSWNKRI